jgi:hypothetical protein
MMKSLGYPLNRGDSQGWTPDLLHAPERSKRSRAGLEP